MPRALALVALVGFAACVRHRTANTPLPPSPSITQPPMMDLPSVAMIERYCVAATTCIPNASWSKDPLPRHALSVCMRDVARAVTTTTLIAGRKDWLLCGRRTNDCVAFLRCLAGDMPGKKTCLDKAPGKRCVPHMVTTKYGDVPRYDIALECPSRFVQVVTDCSPNELCEFDDDEIPCAREEWSGTCGAGASTGWTCRGKDRVHCQDGLMRLSRCPGDRVCVHEAGRAVCASTESPCPASTECSGNLGEICIGGARRRVACEGADGWICHPGPSSKNAAGPCDVTTSSPCNEATFDPQCVGDLGETLEYCAFGGIRRVSCRQLTGGTCDPNAPGGPLCTTL